MTDKRLKSLIKEKADKVEIKTTAQQILTAEKNAKVDYFDVENNGGEAVIKRSKTNPILIAGALLLALVMAVSTIIIMNNKKGGLTLNVGKAEQLFSYEMVLLGDAYGDFALDSEGNSNFTARLFSEVSNQESEEISKRVNPFILSGDTILNNKNIKTIYEKNKDKGYEQYEYKLKAIRQDGANSKEEYVAYYNQKAEEQGKSTINGIMKIKGNEYKLYGEFETEQDEVEMCLKLLGSNGKFVSVENEKESDGGEYENEFVYTYFDGTNYKQVEIEHEVEMDENSIGIKIIENQMEYEYEIERGDGVLTCEYSDGEEEIEFIVYIHNEYNLYSFNEGEITHKVYK